MALQSSSQRTASLSQSDLSQSDPSTCPPRCVLTLYLLSDSYLGLDQQYDVHLNVTPASISAQVNTEVSPS